MADAKKVKKAKAELPVAEKTAADALTAFNKRYEGKTLTDMQKTEKKALQSNLGKLRFVRIANKRLPKALASIGGLSNLAGAGYVKSEAQVKAICNALDDACKDVRSKLSGTKATAAGIVIPEFEDAPKA